MSRLRFGHLSRPLAPLAAALLLAACAGNAPRKSIPAPGTPIHDTVRLPPKITTEANNVLFHAINLVGTPYQWGGNTPSSGFDCSGLVVYVYRKAVHLSLPRTSHAMSELDAPKIRNVQELATGDLLFFRTEGHRISHVAIYVGNGRFVHAPNSGGEVRLDYITNPYWSRHFAYARRVLEK
ncbi:MAG TPA: C40 family peptidase [Oleiagrimonas sp.]|nr:C40 family peptidase [Oleiagrimonas sp.]